MRKLILVLLLTLLIAVSASAALVNVSQGKTATASSSYSGTDPDKALDGVKDQPHPNHWHSANDDRAPWWMVDLGEAYIIKEVVLWNRIGCCYLRLQDITVEILDSDQNVLYESPLLNPGNVLNGPPTITLTLGAPVPGQYVRVSRMPNAPNGGGDTYLMALAEVEVFADTEGTGQAWFPFPEDGADGVPVDGTLLWNTGIVIDQDSGEIIELPNLAKHVVFLSSGNPNDPNVSELGEVPAGDPVKYGPLALDWDGVYYWRVDEITDTNTITGALWSFAAAASNPVVDAGTPAEQMLDPGTSAAVFEVSALNPITENDTGLSYEWFMVDEAGDIPIGDNSPTIEIVDPNESNEGQYYCKVTTISSGKSTESARAPLIIKRLMHHWPFEGNAEDIVGGFDGTDFGDPDYSVPGISGDYCVDLDEDDAIHIDQGDGLVYKFSISAWVSHRGLAGGDDSFHSVLHQDGWQASSMHWHLRGNKRFSWGINGAPDGNTAPGVVPESDRWYHLVISYDNGLTRAYVDGELLLETTAPTVLPIRFLPGTIGAWYDTRQATPTLSRFLDGKVDDVRIYNYPVDSVDLAYLYYEATGQKRCVQEFKPEIDLNDDCVTDLKDVAMLAATWMECNRIPTAECE